MKIRQDFVTNSSSSSFIITNKTNKDKTLVDFVTENKDLLELFKMEYGYDGESIFTQERMLEDAISRKQVFLANSEKEYVYGDDDGDVLGWVYDYILREGGESESFSWEFGEYYR